MKKNLLLLFASSIVSTPLTILNASSCASKEYIISQQSHNPIACEIHKNHTAEFYINNFTFHGNIHPELLIVSNDFRQGQAKFVSKVVDFNQQDQSFSVLVSCYDVSADKIEGNLSFEYAGQTLFCRNLASIQVELLGTQEIVGPDQTFDEELIEAEGNCRFEFGEFTCYNMPNIREKLSVTSTFAQSEARFDVFLSFVSDSSFKIIIDGYNIKPGIINGKFNFIYDGISLKENIPTNDYQIIGDAHPIIYPSSNLHNSVLASQSEGSTEIILFRAVGITNPEDLKVESTFCDTEAFGTFTASISNWVESSKTFSINLDIKNPKKIDNLLGGFKITYNGETVLQTENIFSIDIHVYIDTDLFNYKQSSEGETVLLGLKDNNVPEMYDTLLIHPWVTQINSNAFSNMFTITKNSHIKYLKFLPYSALNTIGDSAFEGDNNFIGDVELPPQLQLIGKLAFANCFHSKYGANISFIPGNPQLTFDERCFYNATFTNGFVIPTNTTVLKNRCLCEANINGSLVIPTSFNIVESNALSGISNITSIDMRQYRYLPEWASTPNINVFFNTYPPSSLDDPTIMFSTHMKDSILNLFMTHLREDCALPTIWQAQKVED